ncbi:hypothetical protein [Imperialibacter sp.]|uniref:hypothetical protein n=1 Tax=Imperialibacter sp. TaxID=2038411 RepID=UPI0032EEB763
MKPSIHRLLEGNELYHKGKTRKDPEFFLRTSQGQQPKFERRLAYRPFYSAKPDVL